LYDQSFSANGKGQRTSMQRLVGASVQSIAQWQYDARGRQTQVAYYLGLPNGGRNYFYSYDSGDRMTAMTYPSGETAYYKYDIVWRQTSVCSDANETNCYARSAQYTALDQPDTFTYGNGLVQDNVYDPVMKRMSDLKVGTAGSPTSVFNRTYVYDAVGNVQDINSTTAGNQHFTYDHLDRLGAWTTNTGVSESYTYDKLGNILTKGTTGSPLTYTYDPAVFWHGGPYAVRSLSNGQVFNYDQVGNMISSTASTSGNPVSARSYNYGTDNLPTSITSGGVTESYIYDADGERIKRTVSQHGQTTTVNYVGGYFEEDQPSGNTRTLFTLNGQVVAQKETASKGLRGEYYASTGLTPADLKLARTDSEINFDWGTGEPVPNGGIPADAFSVRWTGKVQATTTGTYNFYTVSDDGVRLWVNGVQLINNWTNHGPTEDVGAIALTAGQQYDIKLEYFEGAVGAIIQLKWLPPGGTKQIVPVSQLIPPAPTSTVTYLHGDHLGSVSVATDSAGAVVSRQEFDPWGKVRSGGVGHTDLNYTGQRKDDTGLLYYHARYYDPSLARFVSPDSIVPGAAFGVGGAGGLVGAWQSSKLTVDFRENDFLSSVKKENQLTLQEGFWFQLSDESASKVDPSGPANPQALNRYAYALNNPIRYVDPTGHWPKKVYRVSYKDALVLVAQLEQGIDMLTKLIEQLENGIADAGKFEEFFLWMASAFVGAKGNVGASTSLAGFAAGGLKAIANLLAGGDHTAAIAILKRILGFLSWMHRQLSTYVNRWNSYAQTYGEECVPDMEFLFGYGYLWAKIPGDPIDATRYRVLDFTSQDP
jgi:RHS repeat-associated protein